MLILTSRRQLFYTVLYRRLDYKFAFARTPTPVNGFVFMEATDC